MSVRLTIDVRDAVVRERLDRFLAGLADRAGMHELIGARGSEITRSHLVAIAQTRHRSAERLGAAPSGHWAQAAEKTSFTADKEGATISINQPGISRVEHDITVTPGPGKKYLTIPAIAAAYNQRAYRMPDLIAIVRNIQGVRRAIALGKVSGKGKERVETVWYWLVKSATQKQDRSLLPSDEEYRLSALAGVRDYADRLIGPN